MTLDPVDILLVEDNRDDETLAMLAFAKCNIDKVHVVRDGAEALEYIFCTGAYSARTFENPKAILLDMELPKVDGVEVLRQVRSHPRTHLVPVVVLTVSKRECDIVESYMLGVNRYILKPVDTEQLHEIANQLTNISWNYADRRKLELAVRAATNSEATG